jgi:hypothetical protein
LVCVTAVDFPTAGNVEAVGDFASLEIGGETVRVNLENYDTTRSLFDVVAYVVEAAARLLAVR